MCQCHQLCVCNFCSQGSRHIHFLLLLNPHQLAVNTWIRLWVVCHVNAVSETVPREHSEWDLEWYVTWTQWMRLTVVCHVNTVNETDNGVSREHWMRLKSVVPREHCELERVYSGLLCEHCEWDCATWNCEWDLVLCDMNQALRWWCDQTFVPPWWLPRFTWH